MFGLEFLGGQIIDSSWESFNLWKSLILTQRLIHMLLVSVPHKPEKNSLLAGTRHVAIFGSTEGESSDDSLADLVSAEVRPVAELSKHCFHQELVFQGNAVFGRESYVTFYEIDLLPPRQLCVAKS